MEERLGQIDTALLRNLTAEWVTVVDSNLGGIFLWGDSFRHKLEIKADETNVFVRSTMKAFEGEYRVTYKQALQSFTSALQGGKVILSSQHIEQFETITPDPHLIDPEISYGTAEMALLANPRWPTFVGKTIRLRISPSQTETSFIGGNLPATNEWVYNIEGLADTDFEFAYLSPATCERVEENDWETLLRVELGGIFTDVQYRDHLTVDALAKRADPLLGQWDRDDPIMHISYFRMPVHYTAYLAFSSNGVYQSGPLGRPEGTLAPPVSFPTFANYEPFWYGPGFRAQTLDFHPVTVTITEIPGPPMQYVRLPLTFSGNCFGAGATGYATVPTFGPVESVTLLKGGNFYATTGRKQPSLSIAGVEATITYTKYDGYIVDDVSCNLPYWAVQNVSIQESTGNWEDGQAVTFVMLDGTQSDGEVAYGIATAIRQEPQLSLTQVYTPGGPYAGEGAVFALSLAANPDQTWSIASVEVLDPGYGYSDGSTLTVYKTGFPPPPWWDYSPQPIRFTTVQPATVVVRTTRVEPYAIAGPYYGYADLGVVFVEDTSAPDGRSVWRVSQVSVSNGGSGHNVGDPIDFYFGEYDTVQTMPVAVVGTVGQDGELLTVEITNPGAAWGGYGPVESCEVEAGGKFYEGVLASVSMVDGGRYFRPDSTLPPIVADVTVGVSQPPESSGAGAVISANIDTDIASTTFGRITSLSLVNGGDGYVPQSPVEPCGNAFP
jgi:hypothetical protein